MSLTDDEAYAVNAYISAQGGIIGETDEMNTEARPAVEISNHNNSISQRTEP